MTEVFKNYAQKGHYYCIDTEREVIVEVVMGDNVTHKSVITKAPDYQKAYEHLQEPKPNWLYSFGPSNFLDVLVVTGVTEKEILDLMEQADDRNLEDRRTDLLHRRS